MRDILPFVVIAFVLAALGFGVANTFATLVVRETKVDNTLAMAQVQFQNPFTLVRMEKWQGDNPRVYLLDIGSRKATMSCWMEKGAAGKNTICHAPQFIPSTEAQ